jgi:hypothetical protein
MSGINSRTFTRVFLKVKPLNRTLYVGQTGSSFEIRHEEHTRYIKTNNPVSA